MKIILADDHLLFRDGLRSMLRPEMECIDAEDLQQAMKQLETHPDTGLILMDLEMPGMDRFSGLETIRRHYPDIPIIVVSMHSEPSIIRKAMSYGISGYIPKTHSFEAMQAAIDMVLSGTIYVPEEVLENSKDSAAKSVQLSKRQQDVYHLLMRGLSNQEIADSLFISLSTVKMHVSTILRITGAGSRSQLLASGSSRLE